MEEKIIMALSDGTEMEIPLKLIERIPLFYECYHDIPPAPNEIVKIELLPLKRRGINITKPMMDLILLWAEGDIKYPGLDLDYPFEEVSPDETETEAETEAEKQARLARFEEKAREFRQKDEDELNYIKTVINPEIERLVNLQPDEESKNNFLNQLITVLDYMRMR